MRSRGGGALVATPPVSHGHRGVRFAQSAPTAGKALLGVGALVGGALLIFQEIDTALEVAGIFAAGQFALRRLLFAEDRKKTQEELKCARARAHACALGSYFSSDAKLHALLAFCTGLRSRETGWHCPFWQVPCRLHPCALAVLLGGCLRRPGSGFMKRTKGMEAWLTRLAGHWVSRADCAGSWWMRRLP